MKLKVLHNASLSDLSSIVLFLNKLKKNRDQNTIDIWRIILMGNKNYSFQAYILFLVGINITFCMCTILFVRAHSFV